MPTKRPRLLVTESDELARALDGAATRWPELSRPQLLARLAIEAEATVQGELATDRRLSGVRCTAGVLAGAWPADARRGLRDEWPE